MSHAQQIAGSAPGRAMTATGVRPHPAVVRIIAPEQGGASFGSGTLIWNNGSTGLIITNHHVIGDAVGPIYIATADGSMHAARILRKDDVWDLAILEVDRLSIRPVRIAATAPRRGEILTIAGYGNGTYRQASGRCVNYVSPGEHMPSELVSLSAVSRLGDSGGPIFNERGELAGVLFGSGGGETYGAYCGRVGRFINTTLAESGLLRRAEQIGSIATTSPPADDPTTTLAERIAPSQVTSQAAPRAATRWMPNPGMPSQTVAPSNAPYRPIEQSKPLHIATRPLRRLPLTPNARPATNSDNPYTNLPPGGPNLENRRVVAPDSSSLCRGGACPVGPAMGQAANPTSSVVHPVDAPGCPTASVSVSSDPVATSAENTAESAPRLSPTLKLVGNFQMARSFFLVLSGVLLFYHIGGRAIKRIAAARRN